MGILVLLLAVLLVGVQLFGLKVYTVLSGSMEPDYPTGSVIYVKEVDPSTLEVNDVITFQMPGGTTATHRIIELVPDENDPDTVLFRTKGDANDVTDGSLVDHASVIGKPVFCIPLLGYLITYIKQPPGVYIAVAVVTVLVVLEIIMEITSDNNRNTPGYKKSKNDKKETLQ